VPDTNAVVQSLALVELRDALAHVYAWSRTGGSSDLLIKETTGTPTDGERANFQDMLTIN
jgi:hypothetical protein